MGAHLSENTLNYLSTYSTPRHTQLLKEDKAWTCDKLPKMQRNHSIRLPLRTLHSDQAGVLQRLVQGLGPAMSLVTSVPSHT